MQSTKPTNTAYAFMRLSTGYYKITKDLLERDPEVLQALAKHLTFKIDSKLLDKKYVSFYKNIFYFLSLGRHLENKFLISESKELTPILGKELLENLAKITSNNQAVIDHFKNSNEHYLQIINSAFSKGGLGEIQITFDDFLLLFIGAVKRISRLCFSPFNTNNIFVFESFLHIVKNIQVTGNFILLKQIEDIINLQIASEGYAIDHAYILATFVEQIGAQLIKQANCPKDLKMACLRIIVQLLEKFHWGTTEFPWGTKGPEYSLLTINDSFFNLGIRFIQLLSEGSCELPTCTVRLIYDLEKLIRENKEFEVSSDFIGKLKEIKDRLLNLDNILAIKDNPMKLHFLEQKIAEESFVPSFEIISQLTGCTDMQLSLLQKMTNQTKISFNCEEVLGFLQGTNLSVNNVNACTKLIEQVFLKIHKDAGAKEKVQAVIDLKEFYERIQEKLPNNSNSNNYKMITEGRWRGIAVQLDISIADVETLIYHEKISKAFWTFLQYLKDQILLTNNQTTQEQELSTFDLMARICLLAPPFSQH